MLRCRPSAFGRPRSSLVIATSNKRCLVSSNNTGRRGPSAGNQQQQQQALRRPEYLQKLRVSNPISQEALGGKFPQQTKNLKNRPNSNNSNLVNLIRQTNATSTTSTTPSATQSNLPSNSTNNTNNNNDNNTRTTSDLVDFFKKRLGEHNTQQKKHAANNNNKSTKHHNAPPPKQLQSWRHGLRAAKQQVQQAHNNKDPTSVLAVLNNPPSTSNSYSNSNTGSVSLIGQYVAELQKRKSQQQTTQETEQSTTTPESSTAISEKVPSWRKTVRDFSNNPPIIYNPQQQPQQQTSPAPPPPTTMRRRPPVTFEEPPQEKFKPPPPKQVQVDLPPHDISIRELSRLSSVKATKIMHVLQDLGELARNRSRHSADADLEIDPEVAEMVLLELNVPFTKQQSNANTIDKDHEQLMERRRRNESIVATTTTTSTPSSDVDEEQEEQQPTVAYDSLPPRAPVVCIMGHVDHGKTTLMDALRRRAQGNSNTKKQSKKKKTKKAKNSNSANAKNTDVAGTEAGGITQVVSAFQVPLDNNDNNNSMITFLDTPGHAAFSAMRNSGSHAADILLLVVAADDGVQPQTIEIINTYKSIAKESGGEGITMVVAMNKIDKPGIDVAESQRRIENQLLEHDIYPEGASGSGSGAVANSVQFFPISAKTCLGLEDLVEGLALQSEVMDLRADITASAEGIVMDSRAEQGLGIVVDAIVRWGCIRPGDVVVSDTSVGKVRLLKDVNNGALKKGLPSQPVRIVGFKSTPKAGDPLVCVASEQEGNELVEKRLAMQSQDADADAMASFSQVQVSGCESMTSTGTERRLERYELSLDQEDAPIRIPVVLKASADGSVSAVREAMLDLAKLSSFDINVDTISEGVGPLSTSEIEMARESNASIFCFDVKNQDKNVLAMAEAEGVKIHEFDVIYSLLDEAKEVFTNYLPALPVETVHGKAKVEAVFEINGGKDSVAGLKVLEGFLFKTIVDSDKGAPVQYRVLRDGTNVTTDVNGSKASSLKKFKDDVDKVRQGEECGLSLLGPVEYQEGDFIECYSIEMKKSFTGAVR
ncbi:factor IF-2 [Seminavis robusta]|uniref:Factor IF-2 n=1 Tax=Seminavis robusta TaxID=568900 RepID=A0A9N8DGW4_9STRA|nr:factor IF-2 [Seminavis robusta]|eukprot:Sro81_g043420.1 factor IF-2 (1047) ;mRNA; r:35460-38698